MPDESPATPETPIMPLMPTGSGIADLEIVREQDAIFDGDTAGDEVIEEDRLKE